MTAQGKTSSGKRRHSDTEGRARTMRTTVSAKGQVVLPKTVRNHKQWPSGTRLLVEETADGVLLKRAPAFPVSTIDEAFGYLAVDGPARSIEEMDEAVLREAKKQFLDTK